MCVCGELTGGECNVVYVISGQQLAILLSLGFLIALGL